MIKGVITGDLVNSTNIAAEWRQAVVGALYKCAADFSPLTPINIEKYRVDRFKVVVGNPAYSSSGISSKASGFDSRKEGDVGCQGFGRNR